MAIDLSLIEQLEEFDTALITEGMAVAGCEEKARLYCGRDVRRLTTAPRPMVGAAITLSIDSTAPAGTGTVEMLWECCEQIRKSRIPHVIVIKSHGERPSHGCVLGDGMAKALRAAGAVGVVTDGGVRDLATTERVGMTVFAAGTVAAHGDLVVAKPSGPVAISGVQIGDGDLIHGDADGVVMIPLRYQRDLIEACLLSREFETRVHTFWRRSDKSADEKKQFVSTLLRLRHQKWDRYLAHKADWAAVAMRDVV
jgi:regulator of RNase E activity RraA